METHTCPHCGHGFKAAAQRKTTRKRTTTGLHDEMTQAERFAYFKRIAPAEDVAFVLRLHPALGPAPENPTKADAHRVFARARELNRRPWKPSELSQFDRRIAERIARALAAGLKNDGGNWPPPLSEVEASERSLAMKTRTA